MQRKSTSGIGQKELAIAYTDRPVSGWGGLVSVFRFFERLGVRRSGALKPAWLSTELQTHAARPRGGPP